MGGRRQLLPALGNLRRSRGYAYEHGLVERLNRHGFVARRLGGSSTGLPDIVAVNNSKGILLTIEAKSGTGDILYVPQDQIERCMMVREMFSVYPTRHVVFAFKFMSKKRFRRMNKTVYEQRRLVEYYKVADALAEMRPLPPIVKCTYDGRTYAMFGNGGTVALDLPELPMPFKKQNKTIIVATTTTNTAAATDTTDAASAAGAGAAAVK